MLERLPASGRGSGGIHTQQAARLQELVEFIQSQVFFYQVNGYDISHMFAGLEVLQFLHLKLKNFFSACCISNID